MIMLCVNKYPKSYIEDCHQRINQQLTTFRQLASAAQKADGIPGKELSRALATFETSFFNNLVLAMDRSFNHRSRTLELKDGNPLNEVRVLCDSILETGGRMTTDSTIKMKPENSVLKFKVGDEIKISASAFAKLSEAFFADMHKKFAI